MIMEMCFLSLVISAVSSSNQYALSRLDICEDVHDSHLLLIPTLIQLFLTLATLSDK